MNKFVNFIPKESKDHLHIDSFNEIVSKMECFIDECRNFKEDKEAKYLRYVLDSSAGSGKTESLKTILSYYAAENIPMLLCFNSMRNLDSVYNHVKKFASDKSIPMLANKITSDNAKEELEKANQYKYLFITSQRLADLDLGYGVKSKILRYKDKEESIKRLVIVDEVPCFFHNTAIFDAGAKDNFVNWIDNAMEYNYLLQEDSSIHYARHIINSLLSDEITKSESTTTINLRSKVSGRKEEEFIDYMLSKIKGDIDGSDNVNILSRKRMKWFEDLFNKDNVGYIEKNKHILCGELVKHENIGNHILALDASAQWHKLFYDNVGFNIVHVKDFHDYNRLHIDHVSINTSSNQWGQKNKPLQEIISADINKFLREKNELNVFPLMKKDLIYDFKKNGVISPEQHDYFTKSNDDDFALNMLNTVGTNVLNKYNSLALLHLPYQSMIEYRLKAICVYGVEIDLSKSEGNNKKWFNDDKVNIVFEEVMRSDLYQIIMRTSLRNINSNELVYLHLYTKRKEWVSHVKEMFGLKNTSVNRRILKDGNKNNFIHKAEKWADLAIKTIEDHQDGWGLTGATVGDVGRGFRDFVYNNYTKEGMESHKKIIDDVFKKKGIRFTYGYDKQNKWVRMIEKIY